MKNFLSYNDELKSLVWLWNWKGTCIGYRSNDYLCSSEGKVIGKFFDKEIFSPEGAYLCELHTNGRLGIDKSKVEKKVEPFEMPNESKKYEKPQDASSLTLYPSFLDFSI